MTTQKKITFIGGGNLAYSIVSGLIANGYDPEKLCVTNPGAEKLARFQEKLSVRTSQHNPEAAAEADVLVLAVKPQKMKGVCEELKSVIQRSKPLLISVAAGVNMASLNQWLGEGITIIRAMPNTPTSVRVGATGLYAGSYASLSDKHTAESIMRAVGLVVWVKEESHINSIIAVSGSGPAYIFLIMECMQRVGEKLGSSSSESRLLTVQTVLGAAQMALETGKDLTQLRQWVTSPGGTTERAIKVLEDGNIYSIFEKAMLAAVARAEELE